MKDFIRHTGDNIYPDGIDAREALDVLKDFFLGENWYISDPVSPNQANVYIVNDILSKFPRKYKKFCKKKGWVYKK